LDIDQGSGGDNNVVVKDWLEEGRKHLDDTREALRFLCEPVETPKEVEQFLHYFCGDAGDPHALTDTEALRIAFYKAVAAFVRAYAALAQSMEEAGYSPAEAAAIPHEVETFGDLRAAIKRHSGEELDIKPFEADMRHLLNTYVQADPAEELGDIADLSLTELIIRTGIHDAIATKLNAKGQLSKKSIAEGIINNLRKTIIRDQLTDPRFYSQMSELLHDLIRQSRADALAYEEFLRTAEALARQLATRSPDIGTPLALKGNREASAIFNNLSDLPGSRFTCPEHADARANLALLIDRTIREKAPAGWQGDDTRERQVLNAIFPVLNRDREATSALFEIIKHQAGY
jgi:type I restriction enzyme R subunit